MPKKGKVLVNNVLAGILKKGGDGKYVFNYDLNYLNDLEAPSVSLTLPKTKQTYQSEYLFPFFFNMLSEGVNKKLQCRQLKIDEKDYFSLLLATTQSDTIGAITLKPAKTE